MPETTRRPAVRTVLVVGVLIVSALHLGDGAWRSRAHGIADFPIFISEAEAFLDTGVLYPYTDQPAMYAPATAVYKFPPLFATLLLPFAKAPRGPVYFGHWVLQLVCYLGICAWLVVQQRGHPRRRRLAIVTVVLLLNTEPFYETLWRLQLETYVLLAIVAALSALRRDDDARAGFWIGAAATLKVYPAAMLACWLARRRWSGLVGATAAGIVLTIGTLLVIGVADHVRWFTGVLPHMLGEAPLDDVENVSLAAASMRWLPVSPDLAGSLQRLVALPALLAAIWLAATRAAGAVASAAARLSLGLFVSTTLLAMPNAWANYQLLLLAPIVLVLEDELASRDAPGLAAWLVLIAAATLLFSIPCPREMIGEWPCADTPRWLGLAPLPRTLHDLLAATRILAVPLVWVAGALCLARRPATPLSRAASARS